MSATEGFNYLAIFYLTGTFSKFCTRMMFCQNVLGKCATNLNFSVNILFMNLAELIDLVQADKTIYLY